MYHFDSAISGPSSQGASGFLVLHSRLVDTVSYSVGRRLFLARWLQVRSGLLTSTLIVISRSSFAIRFCAAVAVARPGGRRFEVPARVFGGSLDLTGEGRHDELQLLHSE